MKNNRKKYLSVKVWRSKKEIGGFFEKFSVPFFESQTILDLVSWIQQNEDPSLTYRFACRVGMCGSCAMMVNGEPRWTCRTHVNKILAKSEDIEIAPLRNLPVIKDLVTNMDKFFEKWIEAEGVFHPTKTKKDKLPLIKPDTEKRVEVNNAIECINCGICYSACDLVSANSEYLGPAALNRAWSLLNDERDGAEDEIIDAVSRGNGCHNCHSQQGCVKYCPNELNPTFSIAGLKRKTAFSFFKKRNK